MAAYGGNMVKKLKRRCSHTATAETLVVSRIYGLGGKDFYAEDGHAMFQYRH